MTLHQAITIAVRAQSPDPLDFQEAETVIRAATDEELTAAVNTLAPPLDYHEILEAIFDYKPRSP